MQLKAPPSSLRWKVLAALVLSAFFIHFDFGVDKVAWVATQDIAHLFIFALCGWWLFQLLKSRGLWTALLLVAVVSLVLMVAIELIQPFFGRSGSLKDVVNGALGVGLALLFCYFRATSLSLGRKILLSSLATCAFVVVSYQAIWQWYAVWWRYQHLPQLSRFESPVEMELWRPTTSRVLQDTARLTRVEDRNSRHGYSMRVESTTGDWGRIGAAYQAGDLDWSPYSRLTWRVYNPGEIFRLHVRIEDARSYYPPRDERFDDTVDIHPGMNELELNLAEVATAVKSTNFNLHAIRKMMLYVGSNYKNRVFYIDDLELH
jgi:VanZ family protein